MGLFLIIFLITISLFLIILPTFSSKHSGRVEMHREINLPLLDAQKEKLLFVFFGYTGCVDICTPRLTQVGHWYRSLKDPLQEESKFLFFDLSRPAEISMPDEFAKAFNPEFEGIYLDDETLNDYSRAFDVYYAPSLSREYEYDHTPHLYMLKKGKHGYNLRYIYFAYPYDLQQIETDIKELLRE